ncbi:MAG: glutathione S-transferase family protein [Deltaproteobacteria bacterium]|nr:glutathione S-transferase family protein [Deltaproteobacteria bacterium]
MGLLVEGKWRDSWYDTKKTDGEFQRQQSRFRHWIHADPDSDFPAEMERYHLYVSLACPWAHRALIFRKMKRLEKVISVSIVDPLMLENGWVFSENRGCTADWVNGCEYLYEVYQIAQKDYSGRVTVPVLWDKKKKTIVNNESSEIIRMLNRSFDKWGDQSLDYYPEPLREQIDEINAFVYERINNGVYKCGFATSQKAYEEAFHLLFEALDAIEEKLSTQTYLTGEMITEADWRLFTTLVRFDPVYVGHFKCNRNRILDFKHLSAYLKRLCHIPGIKETIDMEHIKRHYYQSHKTINPSGIVPLGPRED